MIGPRAMKTHGWFVSSPQSTPGRDGDRAPWPGSSWHARQPGTLNTACGLVALGWQLLWERPFDVQDAGACTSCAAAVLGS